MSQPIGNAEYCSCGWPLLPDGTCSDGECQNAWSGTDEDDDDRCPHCGGSGEWRYDDVQAFPCEHCLGTGGRL